MNEPQPSRERILRRLRAASGLPANPAPGVPGWTPPAHGDARLARFRSMLEASRAEVYNVAAEDWPDSLRAVLTTKGAARLLYAPGTEAGRRLKSAWAEGGGPELVAFDQPVETLKQVLVDGVDAALTTARGGIAHTGSLVLWPTPEEPRLMSLLPPIHVVLIEEAVIRDSLSETIACEGWSDKMPTNALLISGPSKTADIEQTLAYGVHGPKDLIVLIIGRPAA